MIFVIYIYNITVIYMYIYIIFDSSYDINDSFYDVYDSRYDIQYMTVSLYPCRWLVMGGHSVDFYWLVSVRGAGPAVLHLRGHAAWEWPVVLKHQGVYICVWCAYVCRSVFVWVCVCLCSEVQVSVCVRVCVCSMCVYVCVGYQNL